MTSDDAFDGEAGVRGPSRRLVLLVPFVVFVGLAALFYLQIASGRDPQVIPSALIGKPVPDQSLAPLEGLESDGVAVPGFSAADLAGKVSLVNVFASWCAPCRAEHPLLVALAAEEGLQIVGINYKDRPDSALRFLSELGNPYDRVGVDPEGRNSIDWGVYGVPETFLVGRDGTIVAKHVGPLDRAAFAGAFGEAVREALSAPPG